LNGKSIDGFATGNNVTADENTDRSLVDFAKELFATHQNKSELDFNLVEPEPAEEKAAPTAAEPEKVAAVTESNPAAEENAVASAVAETREIAVAEAQSSVPKGTGTAQDGRQFRTPGEMADIILNALRTIDGVPDRGFVVTVYGANPWNAMLTINPEAGPMKDAQVWRTRVLEIGARLRQDFDVTHEP
jgi:hypothetical protein